MGDTQVMTVLEAHVPADQGERFQRMFEEGGRGLPAQMVRNFLVRGSADPTRWQVVAIWRSRDALDEYRRSVEVPGGVLMFRAVGAEPTLTVYEVLATVASE